MTSNFKAAGILLEHDGKFLVIKENRRGKVVWNIPGGKCEQGESLKACALREFQEETQLVCPSEVLTKQIAIDRYYVVFVVQVAERPDISQFQPHDAQLDLQWVDTSINKSECHYLLQMALRRVPTYLSLMSIPYIPDDNTLL